MTPETIVDVVLTSLITAGLVAMLWTRLNRLEAAVDDLRRDVAGIRETDIAGIREEMARRSDVDKLREEMAVMRSDLTHVALAVGANRPKPMEG